MHIGNSRRDSITESMIPGFFNLVIWAHEHESIPEVNECRETGTCFLQPGSTVATSLIAAEAKPKHCFLLRVDGIKYNVQPIRLDNVRPFAYDSVELSRAEPRLDPREVEKVEDYLIKIIERNLALIEKECQNKIEDLRLPIIRIKYEHSGFQPIIKSKKISDRF